MDVLAKLPAAFKKDGCVTAGNASGIVDGGAALILASREAADRHGVRPIGRLVDWATVGVEPAYMGMGPAPATRAVLKRLHPLVVSRRVAFPVKAGVFSRLKYRRADLYLAVSKFVDARLRSAGVPPGTSSSRPPPTIRARAPSSPSKPPASPESTFTSRPISPPISLVPASFSTSAKKKGSAPPLCSHMRPACQYSPRVLVVYRKP